MQEIDERFSVRRRSICIAGLYVALMSGCEEKPMRVYLDISLFSYLDRPVFDVMMNQTSFMGAVSRAFYGANGVMLSQPVTLGPQIVTWILDGPEGTPRNAELITAKNTPILGDVPGDVKWLALHIYDDETVEIKLSMGGGEELQTERGKQIIRMWEEKKSGEAIRADG